MIKSRKTNSPGKNLLCPDALATCQPTYHSKPMHVAQWFAAADGTGGKKGRSGFLRSTLSHHRDEINLCRNLSILFEFLRAGSGGGGGGGGGEVFDVTDLPQLGSHHIDWRSERRPIDSRQPLMTQYYNHHRHHDQTAGC
jgi:hypothetical protein